MTKSVGVHVAKTHLSQLLDEVSTGGRIEITNRGRMAALLVPPADRSPQFGFDRGGIRVDDDFDSPLPDDLQAAFGSR